MYKKNMPLKKVTSCTLIFFLWFSLGLDYNFAQTNDPLAEAISLYEKGDFSSSVKILNEIINEKNGTVVENEYVAKAYYLLAKVYYRLNDDGKVSDNLRRVFELAPSLNFSEPNLDFVDKVNQLRKEEAESLYNRAKGAYVSGNLDEARVTLKKIFLISPLYKSAAESEPGFEEMIASLKKPVSQDGSNKGGSETQNNQTIEEGEDEILEQGDTPENSKETKKNSGVVYKSKNKIKKRFPWVWAAVGVLAVGTILYFTVLKKKKKTLTVTLGEGVSGNPASGSHEYKKGKSVNYSYSSSTGYSGLVVFLDGSEVPASGVIKMDAAHRLEARAEKEYTLNVTKGEGVQGLPSTGTHSYKKGELVEYSYSLKNGYSGLEVKLDGNKVSNSGAITMAQSHELDATSDKQYTLKVVLGAGTKGTPGNGTYTKKEGEIVNYDYSLKNGYSDLVVKLNGAEVERKGSFTIDKNYELDVSCEGPGVITSVTVKFSVRFAGANLKTNHKIRVDGVTKIDKVFSFDVPFSTERSDAAAFEETFKVNRGLGNMEIRHEVGPTSSGFYTGDSAIWATEYDLTVSGYTYDGGTDPGKPELSDTYFSLRVAPWVSSTSDEWYRIKNKTISIEPASGTAAQLKTLTIRDAAVCTSNKK